MSKPMAAISGSRSSTSAKVPWRVGSGRGGAWEELVPTGEAGALAIDPEAQLLFGGGGKAEVGIAGGELLRSCGVSGYW